MRYVRRLAGHTVALVLVRFWTVDYLSMSCNEVGCFEFSSIATGTSDARQSISPTMTRRLGGSYVRVQHFLRGKKYLQQWKMVRARYRNSCTACVSAAGSHDGRLASTPGANVLGDVVVK